MPLEHKWYGVTEFAFEDPDGYLITFAEQDPPAVSGIGRGKHGVGCNASVRRARGPASGARRSLAVTIAVTGR